VVKKFQGPEKPINLDWDQIRPFRQITPNQSYNFLRQLCLGHEAIMEWARILSYITGTVDQELLLRNEYLVAENRILRDQLKGRLRLSDTERATLGEIGHRLGRKALAEVAKTAVPDTVLGWYWALVARKFDGSKGGASRVGPDSTARSKR
jgi:hypothetical protein